MDSPVIRVGILLSEGKKVLRCMERICVSQSPRLKWLHLNSFLVFSVWFTLTGTPVNRLCIHAAPPLMLQRGSGPIMKASLHSLQGVCP